MDTATGLSHNFMFAITLFTGSLVYPEVKHKKRAPCEQTLSLYSYTLTCTAQPLAFKEGSPTW